MNGSDRQRAEELFQASVDLPPDARARYLDEHCAGRADLRREVESLLRAHEAGNGAFLEEPAVEFTTGFSGQIGAGAADADATDDDWSGRAVGPYTLIRKIGEGGMGVVYEARQTAPIRRTVALKLIKLGMDSKHVLARFESERQALALLDHPHIAHIHDAGTTDDGRPYFVMEHVPGPSLTAYCDARRLSVDDRLKLFIQVCRGVQHAHQKGIIHRDLKPANIRVMEDDGKPVPKIIDFGVAKALGRSLTELTLMTEQGQLIGTPEYMSPEQASLTDTHVDTRSDIYALGVLLYELLTGAVPFDPQQLRSATPGGLERIIREQTPPTPRTRLSRLGEQAAVHARARRTDARTLMRRLRGDLAWIALKAMEKQPQRRYASASELAADVERHLRHEPVTARKATLLARMWRWSRRNPVQATLLSLIAVLVTTIAVGSTVAVFVLNEALEAKTAAEELANEKLRESYIAQARQLRLTDKPGRRFRSLELLGEAARIRPSMEVRNEAIAAMALVDVRPAWQVDVRPVPGRPNVHTTRTFDANLERHLRKYPDGSLTLHRTIDGAELMRIPSVGMVFSNGRFSQDGRYVAVNFHRGNYKRYRCQVWDVQEQTLLVDAVDSDAPVAFSFDFLPHEPQFIVWQADGWIVAHDLKSTGVMPRRLFRIQAWPEILRVDPTGKRIALASLRATALYVGELAHPAPRRIAHPNAPYGLSWAANGRRLAVGCYDNKTYVYSIPDMKRQATLVGHENAVTIAAFAPAGNLVATYAWDDTTRLWDPDTGEQLLRIDEHKMIDFTPDGAHLAYSCGTHRGAWVVDYADECRAIKALPGSSNTVLRLTFSDDGTLFAGTIPPAGGIGLWDTASGAMLHYESRVSVTSSAYFVAGDRALLTVDQDGVSRRAIQRDAAGGAVLGERSVLLELTNHRVSVAGLHPDQRTLLAVADGDVHVLDLANSGRVVTFQGQEGVNSAAISPDRKWIASGNRGGRGVRVWEVAAHEHVTDLIPHRSHATVLFSPDGRWLVVGTVDAYHFWRVGEWDGDPVETIPRSGTRTGGGLAAFTPDAALLAVTHSRRVVELIDMATLRPIARLERPHAHKITWMTFKGDNTMLAVCTEDYQVHLWDLALIRKNLRAMNLDW